MILSNKVILRFWKIKANWSKRSPYRSIHQNYVNLYLG